MRHFEKPHDYTVIARYLELESARIEKFGPGYMVTTRDGEEIYPTYPAMITAIEKRLNDWAHENDF